MISCERDKLTSPGSSTGATPGRFPLTELVQVPYLVGSAEIGTKVLNDSELRSKYLDAEHKGVKVLLLRGGLSVEARVTATRSLRAIAGASAFWQPGQCARVKGQLHKGH